MGLDRKWRLVSLFRLKRHNTSGRKQGLTWENFFLFESSDVNVGETMVAQSLIYIHLNWWAHACPVVKRIFLIRVKRPTFQPPAFFSRPSA